MNPNFKSTTFNASEVKRGGKVVVSGEAKRRFQKVETLDPVTGQKIWNIVELVPCPPSS
jgi:hypothetical protein